MAYNLRYIIKITQIDEKGNELKPIATIKDPLTIRFNVVRMPMMGQTCASIDIYNLQPSTRDKLFLDYYTFEDLRKIELYAGYYNGKFDLIYRGRVQTCLPVKEKTDVIMRLEAQSGFFVLDSYISSSLPEGQLTSDVATLSLEQTDGASDFFIQEEAIQIPRPIALYNNEAAILETYTRGKAFVDNEKIVSINENAVIEGDVRVIDDSTGLLGIPERQNVTLTVKCIFEPRIKVGQVLQIYSKLASIFDGQYKVWGVTHSGTIGLASAGQCITTIQLWTGENIGRFRTKYNKSAKG